MFSGSTWLPILGFTLGAAGVLGACALNPQPLPPFTLSDAGGTHPTEGPDTGQTALHDDGSFPDAGTAFGSDSGGAGDAAEDAGGDGGPGSDANGAEADSSVDASLDAGSDGEARTDTGAMLDATLDAPETGGE